MNEQYNFIGIVGAAVNLTQRIQSSAEGGEVVIPDSVFDIASEHLLIKRSINVKLKGIQEPVLLHVVEGFRDTV